MGSCGEAVLVLTHLQANQTWLLLARLLFSSLWLGLLMVPGASGETLAGRAKICLELSPSTSRITKFMNMEITMEIMQLMETTMENTMEIIMLPMLLKAVPVARERVEPLTLVRLLRLGRSVLTRWRWWRRPSMMM